MHRKIKQFSRVFRDACWQVVRQGRIAVDLQAKGVPPNSGVVCALATDVTRRPDAQYRRGVRAIRLIQLRPGCGQ